MTNSKRKEIETKAIQDSIDHWTRMIEWVKTQPKNDLPDHHIMKTQINELWFARDCALCNIYRDIYRDNCDKCPLYKLYYRCDDPNSIWRKIYDSRNWKEWLYWAYRMRATLKRLLK